jgi:membrane protein YqaA with SNARE-associated domain
MADTTPAQDTEEILAWERANRTRAGVCALVASIFTLIGGVLSGVVNQDSPSVYAIDALRDAAGQPVPGGGLLTNSVLYIHDNLAGLVTATVVSALGTALVAPVLAYLFRAAQARNPAGTPRIGLYAALIGPILIAIAQIVLIVVIATKASDFASGDDRSTEAAHEALQSGLVNGAQLVSQVALLGVALAFVLVSLAAMRAGLLTRFLGVLGIIVGALPILGQFLGLASPLIQVFWLGAVGFVILGRTKTPLPAWEKGIAVPWPTQQQQREQREREARGDMTGPAPVPDVEEAKPTHSASKKKKRKRR